MIVRSRKYHRRHFLGADLAHHFQSGLAWHLDVEKDNVRPQLAYRFDCSEPVVGSADDFDVILVRKQILETLTRQPLVVGDQYT